MKHLTLKNIAIFVLLFIVGYLLLDKKSTSNKYEYEMSKLKENTILRQDSINNLVAQNEKLNYLMDSISDRLNKHLKLRPKVIIKYRDQRTSISDSVIELDSIIQSNAGFPTK